MVRQSTSLNSSKSFLSWLTSPFFSYNALNMFTIKASCTEISSQTTFWWVLARNSTMSTSLTSVLPNATATQRHKRIFHTAMVRIWLELQDTPLSTRTSESNKLEEMIWNHSATSSCTSWKAIYLGKASPPKQRRINTKKSCKRKSQLIFLLWQKALNQNLPNTSSQRDSSSSKRNQTSVHSENSSRTSSIEKDTITTSFTIGLK